MNVMRMTCAFCIFVLNGQVSTSGYSVLGRALGTCIDATVIFYQTI